MKNYLFSHGHFCGALCSVCVFHRHLMNLFHSACLNEVVLLSLCLGSLMPGTSARAAVPGGLPGPGSLCSPLSSSVLCRTSSLHLPLVHLLPYHVLLEILASPSSATVTATPPPPSSFPFVVAALNVHQSADGALS